MAAAPLPPMGLQGVLKAHGSSKGYCGGGRANNSYGTTKKKKANKKMLLKSRLVKLERKMAKHGRE